MYPCFIIIDVKISIHALLAESDSSTPAVRSQFKHFYPRSPCGERPYILTILICTVSFLSTLSLRRATDLEPSITSRLTFLSTLSLRRATLAGPSGPAFLYNFYPRSPCGERLEILLPCLAIHNFYPRSPCGERHDWPPVREIIQWISIHALLAESDSVIPTFTSVNLRFLSTLSLRRATTKFWMICQEQQGISIHALLAESDLFKVCIACFQLNFYPRSPCGERQAANGLAHAPPQISIHALLAESDPDQPRELAPARQFLSTLSLRRATVASSTVIVILVNFYPRSPCGERQPASGILSFYPFISIHALLAESDRESTGIKPILSISIHALLAESDQLYINRTPKTIIFLSTLSLRRATEAVTAPAGAGSAKDFYPRSPCGERHRIHHQFPRQTPISIHALLAESDVMHALIFANPMLFLSTLSLRRATAIDK